MNTNRKGALDLGESKNPEIKTAVNGMHSEKNNARPIPQNTGKVNPIPPPVIPHNIPPEMKELKQWNIAVVASVLAMVPCISPCCIIGLPIGIWALVVLMRPDVKDAFS